MPTIQAPIPITIPGRIESITAFKQHGRQVAAVLPIHYPRALLRAFDLLPVEVWGPPGIGAGRGAVHLQPYICSIAHNALSYLQDGRLDLADVIIVPHACDSLQGLGSLLLDFVKPSQPVFPLYIPRANHERDIDFFADELRSLYQKLAGATGVTPSDEALMQAIQREQDADDLLAELHLSNQNLPLNSRDLYRLIRSREYLPAEIFTELAQQTLSTAAGPSSVGIPVLLSGILPEPMGLFALLEELGARVVGDDLACCGRRIYPPGESDDPFRRMAESILFAPPDPTRGTPIHERSSHLTGLAQSTGAKGIIFFPVKFCEPELFDLPLLRQELGEAGLPSLVIEIDLNEPPSHQMRNRLGAFLEMLE